MALPQSGIVLAATPIGDIRDASEHLRLLLRDAAVIAAEDTRRLRALAARLSVKPTGQVVSFWDHNERLRTPYLLQQARDRLVVVVSDAGTPLLHDPGFALASAAVKADIPLGCAPGPSAVIAALVLSALPAERFVFDGFVPRTANARSQWLDSLASESRTVVVFESPKRLAATLSDAAAHLGPDRPAAVARELTKRHQQVLRGSLSELAADLHGQEIKGETTLVIGGAVRRMPDLGALAGQVCQLVAAGAPTALAVEVLANVADVSRRELYQAVLEVRDS
jgi:16S rRNA (cytidine1402-2'-O)-methyltransferase